MPNNSLLVLYLRNTEDEDKIWVVIVVRDEDNDN